LRTCGVEIRVHTAPHAKTTRNQPHRRTALSSLARPGFFLSFYFWLDAAAVLSLGFELPALRQRMGLGPTAAYLDLTDDPDSILRALGNQVQG
jgi:hypothetical protein